jgi:ABC-type lipoprotein export system ATPase subunit
MAHSGSHLLLRLDGVTKVFLTEDVETHALSGVHLTIDKGEYVSIDGPSGCGKSTLLSILGLLDTPTDGTCLLNNEPVAALSASERARVRNRDAAGATICMVTHDPRCARHADRTVPQFEDSVAIASGAIAPALS